MLDHVSHHGLSVLELKKKKKDTSHNVHADLTNLKVFCFLIKKRFENDHK